jgi:5'-nucleotidase
MIRSALRRPHALLAAIVFATVAILATIDRAPGAATPAPATFDLRIIAFNDFHGHLEPSDNSVQAPDPNGSARTVTVRSGGAAYLATRVRQLRAESDNSLVISAGDLIGASPLSSGLFFDEPTVHVMNAIGLDVNAIGNHEFDRGTAELTRMTAGGCREAAGGRVSCADGARYAGARFPFIAANVMGSDGSAPFPATLVREVGGIKIGIIGAVTRTTPGIVKPDGIKGVRFASEAASINAAAAELQRQGVHTLIAVMHEGGDADGGYNACNNPRGAAFDIERELDRAISVVITGHTHRAYVCSLGGRTITQAGSFGRLLTVIDLTIDRASGAPVVERTRARNQPIPNGLSGDPALNRAFPPLVADPQVAAIVEAYRTRAAPLAQRAAGQIAATFDRIPSPGGDHALGRLIADAQLAATREHGAVIALSNPGGVRTDLKPGDGQRVTYADVFAAQPFGNTLITLTLSGVQLRTLLEQQFRAAERTRILQPSRGFSYSWDSKSPPGQRVVADSIRLDRERIAPDRNYRVTVNDFLAAGGDGFTVLRAGTARIGGTLDVEALTEYLRIESAVKPLAPDRVARVYRVN